MNDNFLSIYKNFINYGVCTNSTLLDNVLYLISPKILESYINKLAINKKNFISTNNVFINSDYSNTSTNNKFDKKNKNYTKVEDILDTRKNKSKLSKRTRKIVDLDNNQGLVNSNNVIFNGDVLNFDVVKTPKLKKKNKLKYDNNNRNKVDINGIKSIENNVNDNKVVVINKPLAIQDLSLKLSIPAPEIITYLFLKGISVTMNQVVDIAIAKEVATNYNVEVCDDKELSFNQVKKTHNSIDSSNLIFNRPPIITIFGHVDHGKTTLLDSILKTNLVSKEYGGITQSITGYEIDWSYNDRVFHLVFIDTPGHDAFVSMRSRGAQITDIAVLVVAADDGLKPQTIESIDHILSRQLPYIVVINKIDKTNVNIVKIKEELAKHNIVDKEWGGDASILEVSALHNRNIDLLLENICQISLSQSLKANNNQLAEGIILETYLNKKKGIVANLVIQNGTLAVGDYIVSGRVYCKVKSLLTYSSQSMEKAKPSSIVQVLGFSDMPIAGSIFKSVVSEKQAKISISSTYNAMSQEMNTNSLDFLNTRVTLGVTEKNIQVKQLNLIVRTDTQGSLEAILNAFAKVPQQKVQLNVLNASSGNISSNDIELAKASNALVLGFNINMTSNVLERSKKNQLSIQAFNIIYDLLDHVKVNMLNLIEPEFDKVFLGRAIVQTVFNVNKKTVAGCLVNQGKLVKNSYINIYRNSEIVDTCTLDSLKRIKDDVMEVNTDTECGVMCNDYNLWKPNDLIEAYSLSERIKAL